MKRAKEFKDLPADWKEIVLSKSAEGHSNVEIFAALGLGRTTHAIFMSENEEYSETFDFGNVLCESWWVGMGRNNIGNSRNFNTGVWVFNLKNRFGWRDTPLAPQAPGSVLGDKTKEAEQIEEFRLKKEEPTGEKILSIVN